MEKKLTKSEARKLYWSKIPKEERSKRASKTAKAKHAKLTPKERRDHALKMLSARNNKVYK